jgi:hypothetical protein
VELKKESLVTSAQFLEGFRELVSHMAEKDQEIPRIYSHVAGDQFDFISASLPLQKLRLFCDVAVPALFQELSSTAKLNEFLLFKVITLVCKEFIWYSNVLDGPFVCPSVIC